MAHFDVTQPGNRGTNGYRIFLLAVLAASLYLAYQILSPFINVLILAIVLASIFNPLQVYLEGLFNGRKNLAALVIVLIITFALAIPILVFTSTLVSQGLETVNKTNAWLQAGKLHQLIQDPRINLYLAKLHDRLPFLEVDKASIANDLLNLSKSMGQFLLGKVATVLSNVVDLVAQFFIMIFIAFYLLRDGGEMVGNVRYYIPLRADQQDRIIDGVRVVANSVLLGTFLTAVCQGLVGGVAIQFLGFPGLFWGAMMALASLIPIVGAYLVWVPIALYLAILGEVKSAVFLALWSIVLIGIIDNFLRPFFMKGKSKMSPFYIFLAILGGVQYFGFKGILYGPLILSFAMIMLFIYGVEYREELIEYKTEGEAMKKEEKG
ncbi:MAG: AI-2E family transporter [Syntrophobacteraceae bacterium]|nr:AI-2E family transporter [Syntrophobacteraceae bacterium]